MFGWVPVPSDWVIIPLGDTWAAYPTHTAFTLILQIPGIQIQHSGDPSLCYGFIFRSESMSFAVEQSVVAPPSQARLRGLVDLLQRQTADTLSLLVVPAMSGGTQSVSQVHSVFLSRMLDGLVEAWGGVCPNRLSARPHLFLSLS